MASMFIGRCIFLACLNEGMVLVGRRLCFLRLDQRQGTVGHLGPLRALKPLELVGADPKDTAHLQQIVIGNYRHALSSINCRILHLTLNATLDRREGQGLTEQAAGEVGC